MADDLTNSEIRHTIPTDHPIEGEKEDALDRAGPARLFARHVLSLDSSRGLVVGVLGPWGSGKTSYVNLARSEFRDAGIQIVDFNPWMFSGTEQLVDSFFAEISAELKVSPNLGDVGKKLEEYGELFSGLGWLPVVGPWTERMRSAAKLIGGGLRKSRKASSSQRKIVEAALREIATPVLVVLDDIDRLTVLETRHVFRLVRLTARFPNIIYLLAFDRIRVENALTDEGTPGRDYLEKILQLAIDLPVIPDAVMSRQILGALDGAVTGIEDTGPFDQDRWADLFHEVVRPLIHTMRDVRRYATAVRGSVSALGGKVALEDVLTLEAIRVFLPETFSRLHSSIPALTTPASPGLHGASNDPLKNVVEQLVASGPDQGALVSALIQRAFPAAHRHIGNMHYDARWLSTWLRSRRVAHADVLRFYLERVPGSALTAFGNAEQAWRLMADQEAFDSCLRGLNPDELESTVGALEAYEDDYRPELVVPGVTVLYNLLPTIPEKERGMFDVGRTMIVGRVAYRLLRSLKDPAAVEAAVREILPQLRHFSAKWNVLGIVGHREHRGHRLVSEERALTLEAECREGVRAASLDALEREHDPLHLFISARQNLPEGEKPLDVPESARLTLHILENAKNEVLSNSVGNRAIRRDARLAWKTLSFVFGDDNTLNRRLDELRASGEVVDDVTWTLVEKYRSGWHPDSMD